MGDHAPRRQAALNGGDGGGGGPAAISDDALCEAGRLLCAQACRFVLGATRIEQLPAPALPELAFAGRSNVGKSSLINALTGRQKLAATSVTPGRTRQLNFFNLGERLMLVDLPGYGYAAAPKAMVAQWTRLIEAYLSGRPSLRRVFLLADARHGLKEIDGRVATLLDRRAVSYQLVLTKCDKLDDRTLAAQRRATARGLAAHTAAHPDVLCTSARTGTGIAALRAELARLADWAAEPSVIVPPTP